MRHTRKVKHLAGRIEFREDVKGEKGEDVFPWRCLCRVDDKHDHRALKAWLSRSLDVRERAVHDLHALVGHKERIGLVEFTITDCSIRILGPAKWQSYIAWDEKPMGGIPGGRKHFSRDFLQPSECLDAKQALEVVRELVRKAQSKMAEAIKAAQEFLNED